VYLCSFGDAGELRMMAGIVYEVECAVLVGGDEKEVFIVDHVPDLERKRQEA
jgi:hypothetical protein